MKKKLVPYILIGLTACMPEEKLPVKDMGDISGYFIECYCMPGESYALNAAKISPISEIIDLSAPVFLDVSITAETEIQLEATHTLPFQGNFRHETILLRHGIDSLYLNARTPEGQIITARTAVPEEISITDCSVSKKENSVNISFQTSRIPEQNYYIFSIQARANGQDDPVLKKETIYMDLSRHAAGASIERTIKCPQIEEADGVLITLLRITEDCYKYQISLYEANSANQGSITSPVPLIGNISGALGIFTCITRENRYIPREQFE